MKLRLILCSAILCGVITNAFPLFGETDNPQFDAAPRKSFVVIGAFVFQKNAKKWVRYAKKMNLEAQFAINPHRNLYYVYSFHSDSKAEAVEEVYRVRDKYKIRDAWVYSGALAGLENQPKQDELVYGEEAVREIKNTEKPEYNYIAEDERLTSTENPDVVEQTSLVKESSGQIPEEPMEEKAPSTVESIANVETEETTKPEPSVSEEVVETEGRKYGVVQPSGVEEPQISGDYKIYVNSINDKELTEVVGKVEVMDMVRNRKLANEVTHELFGLNDPRNGTGDVKAVSRIFGYRPKEVPFSVYDPESDTTQLVYTVGDSIVLDMPLERLKKGDIAVMWNVNFYKDAAVMRPESKPELNSLLEMMQENPDMVVRIHGHTNGDGRGKIIYTDEGDLNFFSMNNDHKETRGSSKSLSEYRSVAIQRWLAFNGIDLERTEIRGWGGEKMLHGKTDAKAYENVRVEIEIVEDGS